MEFLIKASFIFCLLVALAESQCTGSRDVSGYKMTWNAYGGEVQFDVSVSTANGTWIALGFGFQSLMPNSDIVIGSINGNGQSFVQDRWASARAMPSLDKEQNIRNISIESVDGEMMMSFVRDIYTTKEKDISLGTQCLYILAAWGGTVLSYSPVNFSKHLSTEVIDQLICLQVCKDGITPTTATATSSSTASSSISSSSGTPQATNDSSGGGLPTEYIIIIAVVGGLIGIAVFLGLLLICICLVTRGQKQSSAIYELDQRVSAPHPATRRETVQKSLNNLQVTLPINEYQEEIVVQDIYDQVALDPSTRIPSQTRPDSFFGEGGNPEPPYYDEPAREIPRIPTVDEDGSNYEPMEETEQPSMQVPAARTKKPSTKAQNYESMQYDPIRHILN